MTSSDAANLIEKFLGEYVERHSEYFQDGEPQVWAQYVSASPDGIVVHFATQDGLPSHGDEVQRLVGQAMAGLRDAHPELGVLSITPETLSS
jgi:hypothetical protein